MKKQGLLCGAAILLFLPQPALALGVYRDLGEFSLLLTSPLKSSLGAVILRTGGSEKDASVYSLNAVFPLKQFLLMQMELSYISLATPEHLESDFGDLRVMGRAELFDRHGTHVFLTSELRSGSGSSKVFPYASGSIDIQLGVALVDSLSLFCFWASAATAKVNREPGGLMRAERHGDFTTLSGAILLPVATGFTFEFGFGGYFFREGGTRELYFSQACFGLGSDLEFLLLLHAEGGKRDERVSDFGLRAGVQVFY